MPNQDPARLHCEAFCTQVSARLTRATSAEEQQIRAELLAHLEDRMEVLAGAGYDPEEAARRAVTDMGDPTQIGDALNAQFSRFWLWLRRAALLCIAALLLPALLTVCNQGYGVWRSLEARVHPSGFQNLARNERWNVQDVDVRTEANGAVIRVYQIGYDPDAQALAVALVVYNKNPFAAAPSMVHGFTLGDSAARCGYTGYSTYGCKNYATDFDLSDPELLARFGPGCASLPIRYDRYGVRYSLDVPLDWEVLCP